MQKDTLLSTFPQKVSFFWSPVTNMIQCSFITSSGTVSSDTVVPHLLFCLWEMHLSFIRKCAQCVFKQYHDPYLSIALSVPLMSLVYKKKCQVRYKETQTMFIFGFACVSWYTVHGCNYIFCIRQKIYWNKSFLKGAFLPHKQGLMRTVHEMVWNTSWIVHQSIIHPLGNFSVAILPTGIFLVAGNQRIQKVWTATLWEHVQ